ncbi:MAG: hypothetical protein HPZ91_07340 [Lentisphaeria bacterium]|nr:hypothetical protein [Lentisphaeria bacterium]
MSDYETATIFRTWVEIADSLKTDAERGRLYHAICRYSLYGEPPKLEGLLGSYFTLMQPTIDKSNRRKAAQSKSIQSRLQKRLQNGSQTPLPDDLQNGSQTEGKPDCKPNDFRARKTETGTGKKRVPKGTPKETPVSFADSIPEKLRTENFLKTWLDWEAARREQKKKLTARAAAEQLALLVQYSESEAIEMIRASIRNNWQGIFPLKNQPRRAAEEGGGYVPRH